MSRPIVTDARIPEVPLFRRGKVRDVFDLGDRLLIVASDRISAFDVVLPNGIPGKGEILTRMAAFWFRRTAELNENHLISTDAADLPDGLANAHPEILGRFMLVRKLEALPVECVVRGYISGSAWSEYRAHKTVHGATLPGDLQESGAFPEPIFTPTTKAHTGHDEPMSRAQLEDLVGAETAALLERRSLDLYGTAAAFARSRGIIIADTKLEFGLRDGALVVIDEAFTPDSSRFWPADAYAPGKPQPSFDKQFVRDWLEASGWDKTPPPPDLPEDVVRRTAEKYAEAMRLLTGETLD